MALFRACMHWRHYLHGTQPFKLLTDHDSLKYHKTMPNLSGRLARWIEKMAEFDYELAHIPGKDNVVADALSRRADLKVKSGADGEQHVLGAVRMRGIPKKALARGSFRTDNPYEALSVARERAPEDPEQRRRNIDAATKVLSRAADLPRPNKQGTIMTPTQRCSANTKAGPQCAQRTAVAHLCWNHLQRDMGLRVKKSPIPGTGRGLFVAWARGLPKGHRIEYTGDEIALDSAGDKGGPYVLETRSGEGIDAARRNCGLGRWVNDPRGASDEQGRGKQANCEFVLFTPRGERRRVAAVRTLRPVLSGEELLVRYGAGYWRFQASAAPHRKRRKALAARPQDDAAARVQQQQTMRPPRPENERGDRARDRHFEAVMVSTLAVATTNESNGARQLRQTRARQERGPARAGRGEVERPAARAAATAQTNATPQQEDERRAPPREALMDAVRRAAGADEEYRRWLQSPPPGTRAGKPALAWT